MEVQLRPPESLLLHSGRFLFLLNKQLTAEINILDSRWNSVPWGAGRSCSCSRTLFLQARVAHGNQLHPTHWDVKKSLKWLNYAAVRQCLLFVHMYSSLTEICLIVDVNMKENNKHLIVDLSMLPKFYVYKY